MKEAGITFKPDIRKTDKSRKGHKKNNYSGTVSSGILCDRQDNTSIVYDLIVRHRALLLDSRYRIKSIFKGA